MDVFHFFTFRNRNLYSFMSYEMSWGIFFQPKCPSPHCVAYYTVLKLTILYYTVGEKDIQVEKNIPQLISQDMKEHKFLFLNVKKSKTSVGGFLRKSNFKFLFHGKIVKVLLKYFTIAYKSWLPDESTHFSLLDNIAPYSRI